MLKRLNMLKSKENADIKKKKEEMYELTVKVNTDREVHKFRNNLVFKRTMLHSTEAELQKKLKASEEIKMKINEYKSILDMISEYSGSKDPDLIIEHIVKEENNNYMLFQYINEINCHVSLFISLKCIIISLIYNTKIAKRILRSFCV